MVTWALVGLLSVVVAVLVIVWLRRASAREARAFVESVRRALPYTRRSDAQLRLADSLHRLTALEEKASVTALAARSLEIPVPPPPSIGDDERTLLSRVAVLLDDKRVYLSVAGGEQAVANLLDASPDLLSHAWDSLDELRQSTIAMEILSEAPHGLGGAAEGLARGVLETIAHDPFEAMGELQEDIAHVASAGHALSEGFDPADMGGFHFPWVTAIVSTVRETALLADEKTTITRAAAHVAVDVGGVAGGGLVGAKIGAAIGTAIAPGVGSVIGGAIGSVVGAVGGRAAAQSVKAVPLKRAVEEAESAHASMIEQTTRSARTLLERVCVAAEQGKALLDAAVAKEPQRSDLTRELAGFIGDAYTAAEWTVRDARESLDAIAASDPTHQYQPHVSRRIVDPFAKERARREVETILAACTTELERAKTGLATAKAASDSLETLRKLSALAMPHHQELSSILDAMNERIMQHVDVHASRLRTWIEEVSRQYDAAVSAVMKTANEEAERHRTESRTWRSKVETKLADVGRHRAALGMT